MRQTPRFLGMALAANLGVIASPRLAGGQLTEGRMAHWTLVSGSATFGDSVQPGKLYRLTTLGGQLAVNTRVLEGVHLQSVKEHPVNAVFHRSNPRDPVRLNEPFAIYFTARAAYLVHKNGKDSDLGLVDWDPGREPPLPQPAGIFQWEFRSLPAAPSQDHRHRVLKTREPLALFNSVANVFLVYDRDSRELRWRRP